MYPILVQRYWKGCENDSCRWTRLSTTSGRSFNLWSWLLVSRTSTPFNNLVGIQTSYDSTIWYYFAIHGHAWTSDSKHIVYNVSSHCPLALVTYRWFSLLSREETMQYWSITSFTWFASLFIDSGCIRRCVAGWWRVLVCFYASNSTSEYYYQAISNRYSNVIRTSTQSIKYQRTWRWSRSFRRSRRWSRRVARKFCNGYLVWWNFISYKRNRTSRPEAPNRILCVPTQQVSTENHSSSNCNNTAITSWIIF